MSDNFTPLPPVGSSTLHSTVSPKQAIGGVLTLALLIAIGGGVFFVNNTQTTGTKAYSTNECVQQGGYEWQGDTCLDGNTKIGTIDSQTQDSGDGQTSGSTGTIGGSTGGNHSCCVPKTGEITKATPPPAESTATPQDTVATPVASNVTAPPQDPSCSDINIPQPTISITCQGGCVTQQQ